MTVSKIQLLSLFFAAITTAQDSGDFTTSIVPSFSGPDVPAASATSCPDIQNTLADGRSFCCPGAIRDQDTNPYCCVGAPIYDACQVPCPADTLYPCLTTIPVTASDYESLVSTVYLHSTHNPPIVTVDPALGLPASSLSDSTSESSSTPTTTSDAPSQTTSASESDSGSDMQASSSPSSTGAAAIITQAPVALGAAAFMALAAL